MSQFCDLIVIPKSYIVRMISFRRTNANDSDFIQLVDQLNAELLVLEGDQHEFYAQYDKIDNIKYAIVAYENNKPVGCGSIKNFGDDSMEIKRMFVHPNLRRSGVASLIIEELEKWSRELGYYTCVLETGTNNPKAVALYNRLGFEVIPNYGQYKGVDTSICFRKKLETKD